MLETALRRLRNEEDGFTLIELMVVVFIIGLITAAAVITFGGDRRDTELDKVAKFYDQEVEAAVDALTSLIEPLLIAIIGGAVGAAVIALYMPMFNIIKLIQ